jgi:hypothetical protein
MICAIALVAGACGGDDDDTTDSASTTVAVTVAPTTLPPATTTTSPPTTTTTIPLVTEGATVLVANASGINGSAGRMTDAIASVGFSTAAATNSSDTVGQLSVSQIYYDADDAAAEAVATSLKAVLGGGEIELLELGVPAPTESGDVGDATVLLMMGNDISDKSLAELQGGGAVTVADESDADVTDADVTDADATETTEG